MLDFIHETFDQRTFAISIGIILAGLLAVFARRDDGNRSVLKTKYYRLKPIGLRDTSFRAQPLKWRSG